MSITDLVAEKLVWKPPEIDRVGRLWRPEDQLSRLCVEDQVRGAVGRHHVQVRDGEAEAVVLEYGPLLHKGKKSDIDIHLPVKGQSPQFLNVAKIGIAR